MFFLILFRASFVQVDFFLEHSTMTRTRIERGRSSQNDDIYVHFKYNEQISDSFFFFLRTTTFIIFTSIYYLYNFRYNSLSDAKCQYLLNFQPLEKKSLKSIKHNNTRIAKSPPHSYLAPTLKILNNILHIIKNKFNTLNITLLKYVLKDNINRIVIVYNVL